MNKHYFRNLLVPYLKSCLQAYPENIEELDDGELRKLAEKNKIKVHFLKCLKNPRMLKSIGMILNVWPSSLLDIGVGKGFMIWDLIEKMPDLKITCIDSSAMRIERIKKVSLAAKLDNISACTMDAIKIGYPNNSFDMVTLFELLEHVTRPESVLKEALRVAKDYVIFSVPCKPDNNKEHIHFFDKPKLMQLLDSFNITNCTKINKDSSTWYVMVNIKNF